ncbi:hypothetical protein EV421DRAFT_2024730 [Armillaria borealis]|uniref:Uncharacterized protein n=1 Tax=Armillaria borealis TaxID=47425 RepID=A0AA39IV54_9AGAR|nr:hypothetical protein EV421DRAFT_2024730 [Armillaria borealis]
MKVAWLVSIIGAITYVAYIIALILPLVYPYCPFKVPLTLFVYHLYQFIDDRLILLIALIRHHLYTHLFGHDRDHENFRFISQPRKRPLKEIERDHVQKCATKVDAQSLKWLFSSTSNASVHRSVLQAISGMSSATLKWLPDEYRSAFMVPLDQQMQHIEPLVPSPDVERELELYYRAYILLQPNHFPGLFPDRDHMADQCCNEQLKMALFSMTSSKKALAVFLGILLGPQRSSLTLHSVVWKILVNAAISFPPRPDSGALELELELMKVIESPLTTSESGDVTTIDKPTDEMRRYILDKFLAGWRFRLQIPARVATGSFDLIFLSLIPRVQQRLSNSADASDRKQLIQTSLTIVERAGSLIHSLPPERSSLVLNILYSLLSSEAFAVVSPDLQTLAHRIFMILDCLRWYQHWIEDICPNMRFYSVAYQCYLYSPTGGDKRSEKDEMPHTLERLVSYSFNLPGLSNDDLLSYNSDLSHYPHFSINGLVQVMLLLIKEHNESILYEWARHPAMRNVWPECLSRLVRWASGEQFRRWTFLKHVLAVVVIGNLQNILRHSGNNKSLPQYYSDAYTGVNQPPWLQEVFSSSDGNPKYSQIAAHPKFQEFLHCKRPTQEIVGDAGSPAVLSESSYLPRYI